MTSAPMDHGRMGVSTLVASGRPGRLASRRGLSMIELLVVMSVGLLLLAATAPVFMASSRAGEQQRTQQTLQTGLHVGAETLIRGIRSVDRVREGSTSELLLLDGGEMATLCGSDQYWMEVREGALHCGPDGEDSVRQVLANVDSFRLEFGMDPTQDGTVSEFEDAVSSASESDVLAVRFHLGLSRREGRGASEEVTEFVAVIRNTIFTRLALAEGS